MNRDLCINTRVKKKKERSNHAEIIDEIGARYRKEKQLCLFRFYAAKKKEISFRGRLTRTVRGK